MNYHTRTPSRDRDDVARALADYVLERTAPPTPRDEFDAADYVDAIARGDDRQISRIREQSERIADRLGVQPQAGGLIFDIGGLQRRDLTAGAPSAGGYLISTDQPQFAGNLWSGSVIGAVPLTVLRGLVGNVAIAQTTAITTGWIGEAEDAPDAAATFAQRVMQPRTVAVMAKISRQLDSQVSTAGRAHVVSQLLAAIRQAADAAVIGGSGGNQPVGLLSISGTTSVSGTSLGWSGICDMFEAVEGRAVGGLAFVCGTGVAKLLRSRERFAGSGPILDAGRIAGRGQRPSDRGRRRVANVNDDHTPVAQRHVGIAPHHRDPVDNAGQQRRLTHQRGIRRVGQAEHDKPRADAHVQRVPGHRHSLHETAVLAHQLQRDVGGGWRLV
ncbi:MAG: phage major capsid protein [Planctomycetota bacterium]|nr:MAG: phage major capsid protein [Planctomycetota bacterium]